MRRAYSRSRRLENPVNYFWWQPNSSSGTYPSVPFPGEHQWTNFQVGSNDIPNVNNLSSLSFDTPEQTRFGSQFRGEVWNESPDNVGQKVPLNARLLWTTGKVHVNLKVPDTTLVRVAVFEAPSSLISSALSAGPADIANGVAGNLLSYFWGNDTSVQTWRSQRRPNSPYYPLWTRNAVMVPRFTSEGDTGQVAHTFNIKIRHPTGNVRNSDASALILLMGTRARGGDIFTTGADTMVLLRTSFVV